MIEMKNTDLEPSSDLGLTVGYTRHCIERNLSGDTGAGVNAVSKLNLALAATDPLSEIVWSPHKGLILRCADYSFFNKKSSHFWDAGPSIMVLSPQQGTDRITVENNVIRAQDTFQIKSEILETDARSRPSASDGGKISESGPGQSFKEERVVRDTERENLSGDTNTHVMETVEARENNDLDIQGQGSRGVADVVSSIKEPSGTDKYEGINISLCNQKIGGRVESNFEIDHGNNSDAQSGDVKLDELAAADKEEANNRIRKVEITEGHLLERLESTDENHLQALNLDTALVTSGSCQEFRKSSQQNDKQCHEVNNTISVVKMDQKKLKEKLYDEEANKGVSKEDDESHGSVESCNSAGFISSIKKRRNFEGQLIDGSKRVKRQISASPSSSGFIKNDSTFMNWISNLVKGFARSVEDEAPNLALTLKHHDIRHSPDEMPTAKDTGNNHGCQNTGFHSVFRSLYSPNTKFLEMGDAHPCHAVGGSKKLEPVKNVCEVGATPLASHGGVFCQSIMPLRMCDEVKLGSEAVMFTGQEGPSNAFMENSETKSVENRNKNRSVFPNEKNVSASFSNNPDMKSVGDFNPDLSAEQKPTHNFGKRSDLLSSLWVKRFSPKCADPFPSQNHLDKDTSLALDFPADGSRTIIHYTGPNPGSSDHVVEESKGKATDDLPVLTNKKLEDGAVSAEASVDFDRARGNSSPRSIPNFNLFLPSPRDKTSEAMASTFAKRLDALKYISTLDATHNGTSAEMTCFFCGATGQHLQNCPEVLRSEVKGLSRNNSPFNNAEKPPSCSFKSFQPNHSSVAHQKLLSKGKQRLESGAIMNSNHPSEQPLDSVTDSYLKMQERREYLSADADGHNSCRDSYIRMQRIESCGMLMSYNAVQPEDFITSSSRGNRLDDKLAFANPSSYQNAHEPKKMFELVKRLRLSRSAILNLSLMNSHVSTSHLNGFFLRLRLGKWEEGLGGTGYYVAFITGVEGEKHSDGTKNRISVNVGGITCLVESQYISNNDFLQEELMAWWHATLRSGGHMPSEEDLRTKLEERKMLGF